MNTADGPSKSELEDAECWFPTTDRVPGRHDITLFKQRARLHQAQWRDARGYPVGSHLGRDGNARPNGSKLAPDGPREDEFRNFLDNDTIRAAVVHRSSDSVKTSEPGQQFREDRLRYDLLSSMPMCFNLFGELHGNADRLANVGEEIFGITEPGLDIKFEHSPGRQSLDYTNDGTAFDVALYFGDPHGTQTIVGIETKYHEHTLREPKPDTLTAKRPTIPANRQKMPRYRQISERAVQDGILKANWEELLGTGLQQIWRDHMLVLSMLQDPSGRWANGKYVLVHPAGNPAFAEAGETYREEFLDDDTTFSLVTVEDLLGHAVLHTPASGVAFRDRYLW